MSAATPSAASSASASSKRAEIEPGLAGDLVGELARSARSAAGSRSMQISVPSAPIRSAIRRAWPPAPKVASTTTSPAARLGDADQLRGQDWDVLGRHVRSVSWAIRLHARPLSPLLRGFGPARRGARSARRPGPRTRRSPRPRRCRSRSRGGRRRRRRARRPRAPRARSACLGSRMRPAESSSTSSEVPKTRRRIRRPSAPIGLSGLIQPGLHRLGGGLRPDLDALLDALHHDDSVGEGGAVGRRDRDPVLGVEAVLVLSAESHLA